MEESIYLHAFARQRLANDALRLSAKRVLLRLVPLLQVPDVLRWEKHLRQGTGFMRAPEEGIRQGYSAGS